MQEPIKISLTQFIDFTLTQGIARVKCVKDIKYQEPYHPAKDFWGILREAIKYAHQNNLGLDYLDTVMSKINDERRLNNYPIAIKQYKKFCRNKDIEWFDNGNSFWSMNSLFIRSTPELGLIINGKPHLVKLYFKGRNNKLGKRNSRNTLALMKMSTYEKKHQEDIVCSILDIATCRLISSTPTEEINKELHLSLATDAVNFLYLWDQL